MSNNIVLGYFKGGVKDDAFSNTHRESEIGECKIELGRIGTLSDGYFHTVSWRALCFAPIVLDKIGLIKYLSRDYFI